MDLVVRGNNLTYEFYRRERLIARNSFNFLTNSSAGEIDDVGCVSGDAKGIFGFFRLVVYLNDREINSFKKNFWSKLNDKENDVQLWKGKIIVAGDVVGRFERSMESLIRPVFDLTLKEPKHLPLAMCYLPYAVGNRHF